MRQTSFFVIEPHTKKTVNTIALFIGRKENVLIILRSNTHEWSNEKTTYISRLRKSIHGNPSTTSPDRAGAYTGKGGGGNIRGVFREGKLKKPPPLIG